MIIPDIFCPGLSDTPPVELAYSAEPRTEICDSAASLSMNWLTFVEPGRGICDTVASIFRNWRINGSLHIVTLCNLSSKSYLLLPEVYGTIPPAYHDTEESQSHGTAAHLLIVPEVYCTVLPAYQGTEEPQCHGTPLLT